MRLQFGQVKMWPGACQAQARKIAASRPKQIVVDRTFAINVFKLNLNFLCKTDLFSVKIQDKILCCVRFV